MLGSHQAKAMAKDARHLKPEVPAASDPQCGRLWRIVYSDRKRMASGRCRLVKISHIITVDAGHRAGPDEPLSASRPNACCKPQADNPIVS